MTAQNGLSTNQTPINQVYYNANQGNASPALSFVSSEKGSASVSLTDGGGWFQFDSVDLEGQYTGYTITGKLGNTTEFSFTCTTAGCDGTGTGAPNTSPYDTITALMAGASGKDITSLTITIDQNGSTQMNVDNIELNTVPEPTGLVLLGSGILAMAIMVRRKKALLSA
jgi:hypothetical protein